MQNQIITRSFTLALLAGATLWAQSAQIEFNRALEGLEKDTIAGKPYSATAVTTSSQTLSDGTKISKTMQASLARDSEGRTRREQNVDMVFTTGSATSGEAAHHVVTIKDPVAQVRYLLQPEAQTAVKMSMVGGGYVIQARGASGERAAAERAQKIEAEVKARVQKADGGNVGLALTPTIRPSSERKAQVEDLGVRVMEGVNVKGQRETRTIAVGEIGNDRAIQVVSETWYSDDLQAIVYSKHSDPRVGESEYKLTNISRAEPSRSLFEVPAGYTVKEPSREPFRE